MALFADSTSKVVPEFYHFWVVNFTKIWNRKFTDYKRSLKILSSEQRIGMIVPLSLTAAKNMLCVRQLITKNKFVAVSSYEIRPGKLFDGAKGAEQRLNIFISSTSCVDTIWTTQVLRWASEHRKLLFVNLCYCRSILKERIWRFSSPLEMTIYNKFSLDHPISQYISSQYSPHTLHYRSAGLRYWIIFLRNGFNTESASNKSKNIVSSHVADHYCPVKIDKSSLK